MKEYIGFDIGGTNIKAGTLLFFPDSAPQISNVKYRDTDSNNGFESTYTNILNFIVDYVKDKQPSSIGIGFPAAIGNEGEIMVAPNIPGWENKQLKPLLENDLAKILERNISVYLENDANCAALAENLFVSQKYVVDSAKDTINSDSFLFITLGTGIGMGIINKGELFKGSNGTAGEIGFTTLDIDSVDFDARDFTDGTLEKNIANHVLINSFRTKSKSLGLESTVSTAKEIFDIALTSKGKSDKNKLESNAEQYVQNYIQYLSVGISSAINLFGISKVILGGGISLSMKGFSEELFEMIAYRLVPANRASFQLSFSKLGRDAGIIGAASLNLRFNN
ncbi:MAG: ROK family protein [Candidatus Kapaibacteriales bacterium]